MEDLKAIAHQLRKPSGEFANKIAEKMSQSNRPLYDLVLDTMEVKDKDVILEIGFGGGYHLEELLKKAAHVEVNGIDYSEEMVDLAKKNNVKYLESGQLSLQNGDSNNLPFDDQTFDKVFCNNVIYFWDEPEKHLREIHRVLKPGGKFFTGMRTRESMLQLPFVTYGFNLLETGEWKSILESCGFNALSESRNTDPAIEENEKRIQLESICITAVKK